MKKLSLMLCFLLLCLPGVHLYGQCCSAGNPVGSNLYRSSLKKYQLMTSLGYKTSYSDTYYEGDHPADIPGADYSYYNFFDLQITYGITRRLNVQSTLGYYLNKGQMYGEPDPWREEGYGLGDLSLTLKYLVFRSSLHNYEITPSAGVSLPVGKFDQVNGDVELPINLQPSSGSFKYYANLYGYKGFLKNRLGVYTFLTFETAATIHSENFYYKYGNLYIVSLFGSYNITKNFGVTLQVRNENRSRSYREKSEIVEASGYHLVFLVPQLSLNFLKDFNATVLFDWPVYRYYNGIQMGNKMAFSCRVGYTLQFVR